MSYIVYLVIGFFWSALHDAIKDRRGEVSLEKVMGQGNAPFRFWDMVFNMHIWPLTMFGFLWRVIFIRV